MRYSITETKIDVDQSYFKLIKIQDNGKDDILGANFPSLKDAEKAMHRSINYPQVMSPVLYDDKGKKIEYLKIVDDLNHGDNYYVKEPK